MVAQNRPNQASRREPQLPRCRASYENEDRSLSTARALVSAITTPCSEHGGRFETTDRSRFRGGSVGANRPNAPAVCRRESNRRRGRTRDARWENRLRARGGLG